MICLQRGIYCLRLSDKPAKPALLIHPERLDDETGTLPRSPETCPARSTRSMLWAWGRTKTPRESDPRGKADWIGLKGLGL